ncbi:Fructokinase [Emticicia aquatica]|uniref:Fructokinase n=1 Tax=Emticicia aquatica TaxID=1681835 RepID=A0ABM9AUL8_9BACT|nr:ROK family protein [Emticicia aquatica]CAH0997746.1 Fructokinase [Emticicia aquatica]
MIAWGIDLGGTKIECVVLSLKQTKFDVICRKRLPTEANKGYQHVLSQISNLLKQVSVLTKLTPKSIGVATPGIMDRQQKKIKNANVLCLNDKNLADDLSKLINIPVFHANDANCFALAETNFGAGLTLSFKPKLSFGIILGTGVGGGIVLNGQLYEGLHGIAGEWGHFLLDKDGESCYCGKKGCVEGFIAGPALEKYYYQKSKENIKLNEIYQRFVEGNDTIADATITRLMSYFGKALANIINVLDPELIVIGGGVSNLDVLYNQAPQFILPNLFNKTLTTPIKKNQLGDSAGVIGAALLTVE